MEWKSASRKFLDVTAEDPVLWKSVESIVWECRTQDSESESDHECGDCSKSFATVAALRSHQSIVHKYRHGLRRFVATSLCPVCGNDYRSRLRALAHVQRGSQRCRDVLLSGAISPGTEAQLEWADREEQEWRRMCRATGVSLLSGPPMIHRQEEE